MGVRDARTMAQVVQRLKFTPDNPEKDGSAGETLPASQPADEGKRDPPGRSLPAVVHADERKQAMKAAMSEASRCGITRVQSAGFEDEIAPEMEASGELTLRFNLAMVADPPRLGEELVERAVKLRRHFQGEFVKFTP